MSAPNNIAEPKQYWFPAKRYGWGWGPPIAWQGWIVLIAFIVLVIRGVFLFLPSQDLLAFFIYIAVLCAALVAICYVKGEPPAWRSGDK